MSSSGQSSQQANLKQHGPPYPPQGAGLGGRPTVPVDVPIDAVIILLFALGAAFNMAIFQVNRRRGHKFIPSGALFGFCMARITANVLRIVWACYPSNVRVAIAANILAKAGVVILFIVDLIFAQRLLRAFHPRIGWNRFVTLVFRFLFFCVVATLIMIIVATVYGFYTLNQTSHNIIRKIQLVGGVYFAILCFLPIPIVIFCILYPRKAPLEKFGRGRMRTKVAILLFGATILTFGAAFRSGISFYRRPASDPGWFNSRAAYFCVNYVVEIITVYTYALSRFDRRFHVPDGSSAPGHYSQGVPDASQSISGTTTEEEMIGINGPPRTAEEREEKEAAWDSRLRAELDKRQGA